MAKMAYSIDGSPHWNGLDGEDLVEAVLRKSGRLPTILDPNFHGKVTKKGGTGNVNDLEYGAAWISVKTKKSKTGTTDWLNLAAIPKCPEIKPVQDLFKRLRNSHGATQLSRKEADPIMEKARGSLSAVTDAALEKLSTNSEYLRKLLSDLYQTRMEPLDIIFNLTKKEMLYHFKGAEHLLKDFLDDSDGEFFLMKKRKDSYQSRFIMFRDSNGKEHRTTLRLRLVPNNGMGALLAGEKWSSNKASILTLKVQQEDHTGLFSYLNNKNKLNKFPYP